MPNYVANRFAGGAPSVQTAQASALRSYAPNKVSGMNQPQTSAMAPHLSVAAADRPFAADIAMLQSAPEYASQVPSNLDQMWRYSPHTYQTQVAEMLRKPGAEGALADLKYRQAQAAQAGNIIYNEDGKAFQVDSEGNWRRVRGGNDGD